MIDPGNKILPGEAERSTGHPKSVVEGKQTACQTAGQRQQETSEAAVFLQKGWVLWAHGEFPHVVGPEKLAMEGQCCAKMEI